MQSDVLLFAETWTTEDNKVTIPDFEDVVRVEQTGRAKPTGVSCFLKKSLVQGRSILKISNHRIVVNHTASVAAFGYNGILFAVMYFSPNPQSEVIVTEIERLLSDETVGPYERIVIAGDFNVDFASTTDSRTTKLTDRLSGHGFHSALPAGVKSITRSNTFIDIIFFNFPISESGRYISFTSFHDPLYLRFRK